MAFELTLTKDRAYELLELTVANGARPVIIIEDPDDAAEDLFVRLIFEGRKDSKIFEYSDFIMNEAFDIQKIKKLADYCFVVVKNVKFLYGKSATSKILADFVKTMHSESTGVIFIGKRAICDMAEFAEQAEDYVNYIIKLVNEE